MSAEREDKAEVHAAVKAVDKARNFPTNTCGVSRHAQIIGEAIAKRQPYPMIEEEPEHVGLSILLTVKALYEARTEIAELRAKVAMLAGSAFDG